MAKVFFGHYVLEKSGKNILSTSGTSFHLSLSSLILFAFLIVGIVMGIYYLNQPQDIRSQATSGSCENIGRRCCMNNIKKNKPVCLGANSACYDDLRINDRRVCYPFTFVLNFNEQFYNVPLPVVLNFYAYNFQPLNPIEQVTSTKLEYDCDNGTPKQTMTINGDGSGNREKVKCVYRKPGYYKPSVTATAQARSRILRSVAGVDTLHISGAIEVPTNTPKPKNTPTPIPTPTPTVAKKPNGSDCISGSQCQSGICKSCPDQGSKCRPNGYICPL